MPLMILGLIFVIGLFIYYLVSTSGSKQKDQSSGKTNPPSQKDEAAKQEKNVIFLPNDIETAKKKHRRNK